jgi:hypothetical protein
MVFNPSGIVKSSLLNTTDAPGLLDLNASGIIYKSLARKDLGLPVIKLIMLDYQQSYS